jgi:tRNA nucleotidyltransferase/poly(A) polymerase
MAEKKISIDFIPEDVRAVLNRFIENGFDVWIVGGVLRDLLYGWTPKDWDLVTSATPLQVMGLFPRVVPVGIRHGTVQVHAGKNNIEITSSPASGLEGILVDLKRRDFTVNALAYSYPEGELLDPVGGQRDLHLRVLRAVDDPFLRFNEDPLRTLRAGRFMSVYGFDIEERTFIALREASPGLQRVAIERIREEFFKMLLGEYFREAFGAMLSGGVIREILPELSGSASSEGANGGGRKEVLDHTVRAVFYSPFRLRVRLAALFHDVERLNRHEPGLEPRREQTRFSESALTARAIMRRFRTSRILEREVAFLLENQVPDGVEGWSDSEVRRFIARVGGDLLPDVLDLACADRMAGKESSRSIKALEGLRFRISEELKGKPPLRIQDLAIDGQDVMRILNLRPGPAVGEALQRLHRKVLENPAINQPKNLMDFLEKEYHISLQSITEQRVISGEKEDDDAG